MFVVSLKKKNIKFLNRRENFFNSKNLLLSLFYTAQLHTAHNM